VNNELETKWKEAVVAYFKTLSQNFREATDKDTQKKIAA
jgi:hypothetical protein